MAELRALETGGQLPVYRPWEIVLGEGRDCHVIDLEGRRYLDLYGGHCVALTGHCHPRVVEAIRAQAGRLLFYSNAVHVDARARAIERLVAFAPEGLGRVFLCNSGTEANEVALKLARSHTGRRVVVSMREGFHGRTLGSLAATGLASFRNPLWPLPPGHRFLPHGDVQALDEGLDDDVAAVLLEPIPSLGGIHAAPAAYFHALRRLTAERGALLIFDEVQTGFGRTGARFFGETVGVRPDLITAAKGIASGIPAGVVFVREDIARAVPHGDQGTTFGGGPLACAAIAATLEVIEEEGLVENAGRSGMALVEALSALPAVEGVPGAGLLRGIDLKVPAADVARRLRQEEGILVGTTAFRPHQLRLMPPLTLPASAAHELAAALSRLLG